MKTKLKKRVKISSFLMFLLLTYSASSQSKDWIAPTESAKLESPLKDDAKALAKGKKIYYQICATCHGRTGVGDGQAGKDFDPKPADHTGEWVQNQSDGELYWKITNGRGDMPSYSQLLSKTQRWQVLEYIRTLNKNNK